MNVLSGLLKISLKTNSKILVDGEERTFIDDQKGENFVLAQHFGK